MVDQQDLLNQIEKTTSPYGAQSGSPEQQIPQNSPTNDQYSQEPLQTYTPTKIVAPKKSLLDIMTQVSYIILGIVAVVIAILLLIR